MIRYLKKRLISLLLVCGVLNVNAQTLQSNVRTLKDACLSLRSSIATGDIDGLRSANKVFKSIKTTNFFGFKPIKPEKFANLDNHFVFEPEFIDSLIVMGKGKVYRYADRYARNGDALRGTTSNGILVKNILLRGKSTSTYAMTGNGHMELVLVTEPGGLISVTVYDTKHDVYYKECEKEREGSSYRVHTFDLPQDGNAELKVTIRNVSVSDVSCIVMSN